MEAKSFSKEEIEGAVGALAADYQHHIQGLKARLKSVKKADLIKVIQDVVAYPIENGPQLDESLVDLAGTLRAIQDIKGRMTINYLMLQGISIKESKDGEEDVCESGSND